MSEHAILEAVGLSKEEIAERVIERLVAGFLREQAEDEDGFSYGVESDFKRDVDKAIRARIDSEVIRIADTVIAPRVAQLVDGVTLQQTNQWGEKRGEPMTFVEYLVQRAEAYMTEEVSYDGKTKGQDSFSWRPKGTRVAYMIDKHLHYSIETAMKKALADANATIAKGLNEAVKVAISNLTVNVKTEVKS